MITWSSNLQLNELTHVDQGLFRHADMLASMCGHCAMNCASVTGGSDVSGNQLSELGFLGFIPSAVSSVFASNNALTRLAPDWFQSTGLQIMCACTCTALD